MSHAVNYRPFLKSQSVFKDTLYIDHEKHTPWHDMREAIDVRIQAIKARLTILLDEQERQSAQTKNVRRQLRSVGISGIDLLKPETYSIASILKPDELVLAAICGKVAGEGSALLVVSDLRVIYLNQIPFFTTMDEIGYDIVTGVSSSIGQWDAQIILHTRIKDFKMRSVNLEAASNFVYIVERYCIDMPDTSPARNIARGLQFTKQQ